MKNAPIADAPKNRRPTPFERAQRSVALTESLVRLALRHVGPGWFTSVMGTGILGICIAISPVVLPGGVAISRVLFVLDLLMFVTFAAIWIGQMAFHPGRVRETFGDTAKAQLWGAPPMACFTVCVGLLKVAPGMGPASVTVPFAQGLWILGVALSLLSVFLVPYLMITEHEIDPKGTYGSWLLPVVPPIVASVPAALLSATWPAALRGDILAFAYGLLGLGVLLAALIVSVFYARLMYHKLPMGPLVPTLWIVVGPLGQSVAGFLALGHAATAVWPRIGDGLLIAAIAYGVLVWGFGVYWLLLAIAVTIRAVRTHLPFNLGWWAFTFPVGTLTVGTYGLYDVTRAGLFAGAGIALLALLACMWTLVSVRSAHGVIATLRSGCALAAV